ncbi:MAG: Na(+)-translocating NADH-quinone reductase subunit A [Bacteroidales bacterium]|nr:Na(+)-translocating NADH-quinone reductase subunit A [Bacteroidales bacterium]
MPININLKQGLDIPLAGSAPKELKKAIVPDVAAVCPGDFRGLVPRLLVKEGDRVLSGTPVLADKKTPEIVFASPVSGTVESVVRGDKRKLLAVRIKADRTTEYVDFGVKKVGELGADEIRQALLTGGLWPALVQRPYGIVANPSATPKAVFVSAFSTAPLAPDTDFALGGELHNVQTGIDALARLTGRKVYVSYNSATYNGTVFNKLTNVEKYTFSGKHPAGNVGVQIHHISPILKGETVWTVSLTLLAAIGKLFNTGRYDVSRKVAITGPRALPAGYVRTVPGVPIAEFNDYYDNSEEDIRFVSGDALSGRNAGACGYLGFYDNQVTLLTEGREYELLGWMKPIRSHLFSTSHAYFSWILDWLTPGKKYDMDTNLHGGARAFLFSDVYGKVLPMKLYPVYLAKACLAGDIDKMEKYGIYEVLEEDLALCEYVDPSKNDIQAIISDGIDLMLKEMV